MAYKHVITTAEHRGATNIATFSRFMLSILIGFIFFGFPLNSDAAWQTTQSASPSAYECTQVTLDDIDPALLTKQERVALLDASLSKSIDSYSTCVSSVTQAMANAQSGKGAAQGSGVEAGGTDGAESENEANNTGALNQSQSEVIDGKQQTPPANMPPSAQSTASTRGIIPPKDNDKIICKLLFQEITKTQDPDMLKGLKEQYSNYKCG